MPQAVSSSPTQQQRHSRKKPRKPRGRGLRSSSGCTSCRARHVKCDEVKPVCGSCTKKSLICVFLSDTAKSSNETSEAGDISSAVDPAPLIPVLEDGAAAEASILHSEPQAEPNPIIQAQNASSSGATLDSTQQYYESPHSEAHVASPQSVQHPSWSDESAPLRWFGLLVGDAGHDPLETNEPYQTQDLQGPGAFNHQRNGQFLGSISSPQETIETSLVSELPRSTIPAAAPSPSTRSLWQSSVKLLDHELPIFKRFVNRISHWMDLFDPMRHFSTLVPHIAVNNEGLMKAVLGLAARHMSIQPSDSEPVIDRTTAVQYYYETLQYLQHAMKYQSYTQSLELTATTHIVSMYEMIDGTGSGWERHLKGVFWIQRSRNIGAETPGLQGAGWWAWLRQDVWAAFRERRRIYSIHKHVKPYATMTPYDLASRAVYLLAEAVNYSSEREIKAGESNLRGRIERADYLWELTQEWYRNLSVHFKPLPLDRDSNESVFKPIWINPSEFGAAVQMVNLAKVLILVHKPAPGGLRECLSREQDIKEAIDTICGIAMTITEEPAMIISTQCLFAAGLYTQHSAKRQAILDLLGTHQDQTGWPVSRLEQELEAEWNNAKAV